MKSASLELLLYFLFFWGQNFPGWYNFVFQKILSCVFTSQRPLSPVRLVKMFSRSSCFLTMNFPLMELFQTAITWNQALFSFRFENYIPLERMYENHSNWAWSQVKTARDGASPYKTILSKPHPPPPRPISSHPSYAFTKNDGHFSVILHELMKKTMSPSLALIWRQLVEGVWLGVWH